MQENKIRICHVCNKEKLSNLFHREKCGSMYYKLCEECHQNKANKLRKCKKCKLEKIYNQFAKFDNGATHYFCLDCYQIELNKKKEIENLRLNNLKKCSNCKEIKSIDFFYNLSTSKDGKNSNCKSCQDLINKDWANRNPEQNNKKHLVYRKKNESKIYLSQKKYSTNHKFRHLANVTNTHAKQKGFLDKITYLDLYRIAKKQKLICPISGEKLTNNNISIDHIIPYANGGKNISSNIQLVTKIVNQMKFDFTLEEFYNAIKLIYLTKFG